MEHSTSSIADSESTRAVHTTTELYAAIGEVAVASSLLDELLREILADLVAYDAWYLFEGQGSDWLAQMCKTALGERDPYHDRYPKEKHDRFIAALNRLTFPRELRNSVVHGVWRDSPIDKEALLPRPWGGDPDDDEAILYCLRSRHRRFGDERAFTIGDIKRLAAEFDEVLIELVKAFRDMERETLHRW